VRFLKRSGILEKDALKEKSSSPCEANPKEDKVEGMAVTKGLATLMLGPLAAYFIHSDWQILFGLLPTYWPAKAFWVAGEGGNNPG
jgi:hypothetical protein